MSARSYKQFFDDNGVLRIECCRSCGQPRIQCIARQHMGHDDVLNLEIYGYDMTCPDCGDAYGIKVSEVEGRRFETIVEAQRKDITAYADNLFESVEREEYANDLSRAAREWEKLAKLIHNDHIVPEDF